jgi:hypothetical protein
MKILMKKKYTFLSIASRYCFIFIISFMLVMPVMAQTCTSLNPNLPIGCTPAANDNTNKTPAANDNTNTTPAANDNTGVHLNTGIRNPLGDVHINSIPDFIAEVIKTVLLLAIPVIVLAIIYAGFLFVTAQGNSEKLGKAKKVLLYTLVGAAIILGSFVIANAIKGTVEDIGSTT